MHVLHERPLRHDGNAESVCFFGSDGMMQGGN